ncbi:class A beta-lactamase [Mastigocladopsis repens]|uniref:class A beta-lactamase n=1 Tax=Mastigocladopsis repens TaxID=221287 RepID=UPI00030FE553|nr:class A beta-lactamase [Mastigocladopsis repens]
MFSVFVRRFWLSFGVVILLSLMLLPVKAQEPSQTPLSSSITESSLQQEQQINQIAPLAGGIMGVSAFATAQPNSALLQERLKNLDISAARGKVGIGVLDLNSGKSWFLNGKQRFPMQSVFKLPAAIAVLRLVDDGKVSLDQSVTITRQEFAPGSSSMIKEFKGTSAQFTVRKLLERSVGMSDNTAADALVRLVGGPQQVNAILGKLKIRDVRVDRLEQQLQPDCVGLTNFRPELADEQKWAEAVQKIPDSVKKAAVEKYLTDPRDTATPEGIVDLLAKLHSNQLLSRNSTALLLKIMTDSPTGQKRLKAGLPKNWWIAHKTGTGPDVLGIGTATNDVGIASSPDGKRVGIAVFIAGSKAPLEEREKLMSEIASTVVEAMP